MCAILKKGMGLMFLGPKVVFCAGPLVDALVNAQADHHVRFKAVEASFIWRYCLAFTDSCNDILPSEHPRI